LRRVVLCNTAPKIGSAETWNARIQAVQRGGMAAIVETILQRWYTDDFRASHADEVDRTRQMLLQSPPEGYIGCCEAIREMDQRGTIAQIRVPALIISGSADPVTPSTEAHLMMAKIPDARHVELKAAHLSNVEARDDFNAAVREFLTS